MHEINYRHVTAPSAPYRLAPVSFGYPSIVDALSNAGASTPTTATCTASGTPHAVGSWTEIVASTSAEATLLSFTPTSNTLVSATDTATLLDIGIGAAASETAIISNINLGGGNGFALQTFNFPVTIPKGSRLSIRCRSLVASKQVTAYVRLGRLANNLRPATTVTTYGADTANSRGTIVLYPGSSNTKSDWVSLSGGAITERVGALTATFGMGGDTTVGNQNQLFDLGSSPDGSTWTVVVPDIYVTTSNNESVFIAESSRVWPVNISVGMHIGVRAAFSANGNTGLDVCAHAMPWRL